jgi:hypothetical protein
MGGGNMKCIKSFLENNHLEDFKHRGKGNIKMNLREEGFKDMKWTKLTQKSLMAIFCEHSDEPLGSTKAGNFLISRITVNCSTKTLFHRHSYNII